MGRASSAEGFREAVIKQYGLIMENGAPMTASQAAKNLGLGQNGRKRVSRIWKSMGFDLHYKSGNRHDEATRKAALEELRKGSSYETARANLEASGMHVSIGYLQKVWGGKRTHNPYGQKGVTEKRTKTTEMHLIQLLEDASHENRLKYIKGIKEALRLRYGDKTSFTMIKNFLDLHPELNFKIKHGSKPKILSDEEANDMAEFYARTNGNMEKTMKEFNHAENVIRREIERVRPGLLVVVKVRKTKASKETSKVRKPAKSIKQANERNPAPKKQIVKPAKQPNEEPKKYDNFGKRHSMPKPVRNSKSDKQMPNFDRRIEKSAVRKEGLNTGKTETGAELKQLSRKSNVAISNAEPQQKPPTYKAVEKTAENAPHDDYVIDTTAAQPQKENGINAIRALADDRFANFVKYTIIGVGRKVDVNGKQVQINEKEGDYALMVLKLLLEKKTDLQQARGQKNSEIKGNNSHIKYAVEGTELAHMLNADTRIMQRIVNLLQSYGLVNYVGIKESSMAKYEPTFKSEDTQEPRKEWTLFLWYANEENIDILHNKLNFADKNTDECNDYFICEAHPQAGRLPFDSALNQKFRCSICNASLTPLESLNASPADKANAAPAGEALEDRKRLPNFYKSTKSVKKIM